MDLSQTEEKFIKNFQAFDTFLFLCKNAITYAKYRDVDPIYKHVKVGSSKSE